MPPFPVLTFAACQGDYVAERALEVLESASYGAVRISPEGHALPEHVAIVGWSKNEKRGLRHAFPGEHVRIPSAKRVDRNNVPPALKDCSKIVYVREPPEKTRRSSEAFRLAVLSMALGLRRW